jgi:uncharacterized membrane protein
MKTKPIPAIVMMTAGLITCFLCIRNQVSTSDFLRRLLLVLILFYILGIILKEVLDFSFNRKIEKDLAEKEEIKIDSPELKNKETEKKEN